MKGNVLRSKAMGAMAVMMLIGIMLTGCVGPSGNGYSGKYKIASAENGYVSIPASEISTAVSWYQYNYGGVAVKFFAVKGGDGKIRTAFDACDVCYPEKKGYSQDGAYMSCNNCGKKFAVNSIGTDNTKGGCWPGYLPRTISGDNVQISESD
ncbi:MAG: DUF2318 domain-containing protein, partial [Candidatus Thermoplasmatota archaeon]|nr:DUF2318 domain-containing protein [Candidatus Thermoplasmatota archaeon]